MSTPPGQPAEISGIDVMRGLGQVEAKGFWADAWSRVLRRPMAVCALAWIGVIATMAVFAPVLANAHPYRMVRLDLPEGDPGRVTWPLFAHLKPTDLLLLAAALVIGPYLALPMARPRAVRLRDAFALALQAGLAVVACYGVSSWANDNDAPAWLKAWNANAWFPYAAAAAVAAVTCLGGFLLVPPERWRGRLVIAALVIAAVAVASGSRWKEPLVNLERYVELENEGKVEAIWPPIAFSPQFSRSDLYVEPPLTRVGDALPEFRGTEFGQRMMWLGSDALGKDVLCQMLWACRLAISIGLVSTGIAVIIGVTIGALMGYFGGVIDLLLFRVVEIFMAIPVLFLLIVAAGVLPRNTYVMMAIIGCVSWTGAARFTRAEFLKLRNQDFVQASRAIGLPLRNILFRQMLPNGVTPVLVDSSFAVAAAILAEATLSYLGLGPDGQASWGKLLSSATGTTGTFVWWLAIYPGLAIFLTVLAYNLLGEALRDAIDPKLRKAAH
jgi:peptide/nickel transport system permease protein